MNIIVSGGGSGLGQELVRQLVNRGHQVMALVHTERDFPEVGCTYRYCDITSWQQVEAAVTDAKDLFGTVDVLINNAAVNYSGRIEDVLPENIQHIFNVNVVGALYLTKAVTRFMKQSGGGYILNINSQLGLKPDALQSLYGGSKWALHGITKILQAELSTFNIKVTGIYPGALEQTMAENGTHKAENDSVPYQELVDVVEFILNRGKEILIPEIGVKNTYG
jgi:sorbitol-6-phosphate 2-dehydrogenase